MEVVVLSTKHYEKNQHVCASRTLATACVPVRMIFGDSFVRNRRIFPTPARIGAGGGAPESQRADLSSDTGMGGSLLVLGTYGGLKKTPSFRIL